MSTGTALARWLTLDPAARRPSPRRRPEVPRQRTWQEGRWHHVFHADGLSPAAAPPVARWFGGPFPAPTG